MTKRRDDLDWPAIEREWRSGQLSIREIARQHGTADGTIRGRARSEEWPDRDLSGAVRNRIRATLTADEAAATEEQAIDLAARRGVEVVRQHRTAIAKLSKILDTTAALLSEHLGHPEPCFDDEGNQIGFQGQIFASRGDGVAALIKALTAGQQALIGLERQAFNLDDPPPPVNMAVMTDEQLQRIAAGEDPRLVTQSNPASSSGDS